MLQQFLQITLCLEAGGYSLSWPKHTKAQQSNGKCCIFKSSQRGLKIHEEEYLLFIVVAANNQSLLILCSFLYRSSLFLIVKLQVASPSEF